MVGGASAASGKVGWFSFEAVLKQSRVGQQTADELTKEKNSIQAQIDVKTKEFKALRDEFDKKKGVMDEAARTKKSRELADKQVELEKLVRESNTKMGKMSSDRMGPVIDKIIEIVRKIGRDDKYDYIIEKDKGGLVYYNEKEDLTKRIVDELNRSDIKR
jgi:outer membrane protein